MRQRDLHLKFCQNTKTWISTVIDDAIEVLHNYMNEEHTQSGIYMTRTRKQTLKSLSLSYQKKDGCGHFFDSADIYITEKLVSCQKKDVRSHARPSSLMYDNDKDLFSHDVRHMKYQLHFLVETNRFCLTTHTLPFHCLNHSK